MICYFNDSICTILHPYYYMISTYRIIYENIFPEMSIDEMPFFLYGFSHTVLSKNPIYDIGDSLKKAKSLTKVRICY